MDFLYSLKLSFDDLKNDRLRRLSILNGVFWSIVWIILGIILFPHFSAVIAKLVTILPFRFVEIVGAQFILMILWLQLLFITIGVIFTIFYDFFKKRFMPLLISLLSGIFWFLLLWFFKDPILSFIVKILHTFPYNTIEYSVSYIVTIFIFYSLYIAFVYFGFFIISPKIIEEICENSYPNINIKIDITILKLIFILIRDMIIFLIAITILHPILFIPFINLIFIILLWTILIKNSLFVTVEMFYKNKKIDKKSEWILSLLGVFFNFIPIVNFFAPAFGILLICHYINEKED